ncbi:hypothetical protein FHR51_000916 [Xanthomonas arboricola]|nr:hypothetical protein [Xanthomonas cannabis]
MGVDTLAAQFTSPALRCERSRIPRRRTAIAPARAGEDLQLPFSPLDSA